MTLNHLKWHLTTTIPLVALRLDSSRKRFTCPVCNYTGVFLNGGLNVCTRQHSQCPKCGAGERQRLQWLVVEELRKDRDFNKLRVLHMAPENSVRHRLQQVCRTYLSADLNGKGVDRREDLTQLSFADGSFDLVYCSHVLEHIRDDLAAIGEIRRVLSPGGIAILPVPIVSDTTIEYPEPNPHEFGHVRAPGRDYFDRYKRFFGTVRVFSSQEFDPRHQLHIYEDRSQFPKPNFPYRPSLPGLMHPDYVPVCLAD